MLSWKWGLSTVITSHEGWQDSRSPAAVCDTSGGRLLPPSPTKWTIYGLVQQGFYSSLGLFSNMSPTGKDRNGFGGWPKRTALRSPQIPEPQGTAFQKVRDLEQAAHVWSLVTPAMRLFGMGLADLHLSGCASHSSGRDAEARGIPIPLKRKPAHVPHKGANEAHAERKKPSQHSTTLQAPKGATGGLYAQAGCCATRQGPGAGGVIRGLLPRAGLASGLCCPEQHASARCPCAHLRPAASVL